MPQGHPLEQSFLWPKPYLSKVWEVDLLKLNYLYQMVFLSSKRGAQNTPKLSRNIKPWSIYTKHFIGPQIVNAYNLLVLGSFFSLHLGIRVTGITFVKGLTCLFWATNFFPNMASCFAKAGTKLSYGWIHTHPSLLRKTNSSMSMYFYCFFNM